MLKSVGVGGATLVVCGALILLSRQQRTADSGALKHTLPLAARLDKEALRRVADGAPAAAASTPSPPTAPSKQPGLA
jgi:hypothetical protein